MPNLKIACLGVTALEPDKIEDIYRDWSGDKLIVKLCLSHERMRAERDGLQTMLDDLDRKVRHGCAGFNCQGCDK